METAKEIIRVAIENYGHRDPAKVNIPKVQEKLVAGLHHRDRSTRYWAASTGPASGR